MTRKTGLEKGVSLKQGLLPEGCAPGGRGGKLHIGYGGTEEDYRGARK